MPRTRIDIPTAIEYLSILDPSGAVDEALVPNIDDNTLKKLYRHMVLARKFDARQLNLQRQGRIGTFPPISGQEAAHLGAAAVLRPSDWMAPSFRETAAELWRGRPLASILMANNGFGEGNRIADERNDLPMSVPISGQLPHAVGIAWALRHRGGDEVAMTFFGDGGTSEGDFHEALNFAGVYNVPVIFVCQNNQWAISVPRARQTRAMTLAQKAIAYGIAGIQVDGNDILAVYAAAREAVDRARAGDGPTLIEAVTYRMLMHTTADDPKKYRDEAEVEPWKEKDPILRFERYLRHRGLIDDADVEAQEAEIEAAIQEAVDTAEAEMKRRVDPLDMFAHVFAEPPAHLSEQRAALAAELAGKEDPHG